MEKSTSPVKSDSSSNKIIIGVLIVLLLASIGYTYYNHTGHEEVQAVMNDEKAEIQADLDKIIAQYDEAIAENSELSDELKVERDQIVKFRDSVKSLKEVNNSQYRRYRKKINAMKASQKEMLEENEQLKLKNQSLLIEIDSVNDFVVVQNKKIDTLNLVNEDLSDKVAIGEMLKVNSVEVATMKKKSSGQLKETAKAKSTTVLRVSFTIAENALTESGDKNIFVQVVNPAKEVINDSGTIVLSDDVSEINYSNEIIANYANEKLEVISLIEVEEKSMTKGVYTVNVYLEGRFVGVTNFTLK